MQTISSRDVADMIGKRHDNFMRDIKKYINSLGESIIQKPLAPVEPEEKFYTADEVAKILGCSERNVYRNIQSGKLEMIEREVMVPQLRKFVPANALEEYMAQREVK